MAQALAIAGMVGGGILSAGSAFQQGQAASRMATIQANQLDESATQLEESAKQQEGVSQLKAAESKRQARLLQSRVIALAAANGGDTSEKNINDILLNIEGEGEYRALMDLYNGSSAGYELRNRARTARQQSLVTRFEGRQARRAGNMAAFGGLLSSAGSAASFSSKYNGSNSGGYNSGPPPANYGSYSPNTDLQVSYPSIRR